jgi:DNA-binding CsgD family transcriptional regulator
MNGRSTAASNEGAGLDTRALGLNTRDLWQLSDTIKRLHTPTTLDQVASTAVACIQDLIDCDWASVGLASPRFTKPSRFWSQCSTAQDRTAGAFAAFYDQHPIWRAFWRHLRPQAVQLLQISTPSELASLPINHEVLKPLSVANVLGVCMPGSSMFAVGAIRDRPRPFSHRDGLVLSVLSDHLAAAARALRATASHAIPWAAEESEIVGRVEFVALDPLGNVVGRSPGAGATLDRFFPRSIAREGLPDAVQSWFSERSEEPVLCVADDRRRLELRRFDPRVRPGSYLALYEEKRAGVWPTLAGLTPREAEIVRWVVGGKTNPEIGCILGISPRTVQKHLGSVFDKLGVPTRTALVTEVLDREPG